jgi:hypothetical protein
MANRKLKRGDELNGRYSLKGSDFMLVQYYPGVDSFYAIINNDPGAQFNWGLTRLRKFLKEYCPDKNCLNLY